MEDISYCCLVMTYSVKKQSMLLLKPYLFYKEARTMQTYKKLVGGGAIFIRDNLLSLFVLILSWQKQKCWHTCKTIIVSSLIKGAFPHVLHKTIIVKYNWAFKGGSVITVVYITWLASLFQWTQGDVGKKRKTRSNWMADFCICCGNSSAIIF